MTSPYMSMTWQAGLMRRPARVSWTTGAAVAADRPERHISTAAAPDCLSRAAPDAVRDEPAPVLRMAECLAMVGKFAARRFARHSGTRRITQYMISARGSSTPPRGSPPRHPAPRRCARGGSAQPLSLRELLAGVVIGVPDLRRDWRRVVFEVRIGIVAAVHHHAAEREMNEVRAFEIGPWTVIAATVSSVPSPEPETGVEARRDPSPAPH